MTGWYGTLALDCVNEVRRAGRDPVARITDIKSRRGRAQALARWRGLLAPSHAWPLHLRATEAGLLLQGRPSPPPPWARSHSG